MIQVCHRHICSWPWGKMRWRTKMRTLLRDTPARPETLETLESCGHRLLCRFDIRHWFFGVNCLFFANTSVTFAKRRSSHFMRWVVLLAAVVLVTSAWRADASLPVQAPLFWWMNDQLFWCIQGFRIILKDSRRKAMWRPNVWSFWLIIYLERPNGRKEAATIHWLGLHAQFPQCQGK